MDVKAFKEAQEAYSRGDYAKALKGFAVCAQDMGDLSAADLSKFYHLIGNCYVKNGEPANAAQYYKKALENSSKSRRPALFVNLGTALLNSKDYENALKAFQSALNYNAYATPYRAYSGIGAAQLKLGNTTEAGAAYREAALDPTNPMPAKALVNLGVCFMELGRASDAIVAYETALDFNLDRVAEAKARSNLGQAYMAEGRVQKAIESFEAATAEGVYQLTPMARHDYEIACKLRDRLDGKVPGILNTGFIPNVSMIDDLATDEPEEELDPFAPKSAGEEEPAEASGEQVTAAEEEAAQAEPLGDEGEAPAEPADGAGPEASGDAGPGIEHDGSEDVTVAFVPVDEGDRLPIENSIVPMPDGTLVKADDAPDSVLPAEAAFAELDKEEDALPSPDDTSFFDLTENEINIAAKNEVRKARKRRGVGLKVAIFIVVVLILLAAAAAAAYFFGYGFPTQESVAEEFVAAAQADQDTSRFWADNVDESSRASQVAVLKNATSAQVDAVERSMSQSVVYVKAQLQEGGEVYYEVVMGRSGISWSVQYVELYFPSEQ